ncbi:MAG: nucleotidyl transferase AbiEii/AbiGii toxin family protein [Bacteroidota bacterium]
MRLHEEKRLFSDILRATSDKTGIKVEFVEKDYWITLILNRLAGSKFDREAVFKGGTSLSKGFGLIDRFSEDIDIAIISRDASTGNEIKNIIRSIEKEITADLREVQSEGVTSKGSRFRKSVFEYDSIEAKNNNNKLIVEINSFANPFPFRRLGIKCFVSDFLQQTRNEEYIDKYGLDPFEVNVLNKEQTMLEKVVSLIRFSFDEDYIESLKGKIRHFYDLYFLMNDAECADFIQSERFKQQFSRILNHDRVMFEEPHGWQVKKVNESPLVKDFEAVWKQLKEKYKTELTALAYSPIPEEAMVGKQISALIGLIQ